MTSNIPLTPPSPTPSEVGANATDRPNKRPTRLNMSLLPDYKPVVSSVDVPDEDTTMPMELAKFEKIFSSTVAKAYFFEIHKLSSQFRCMIDKLFEPVVPVVTLDPVSPLSSPETKNELKKKNFQLILSKANITNKDLIFEYARLNLKSSKMKYKNDGLSVALLDIQCGKLTNMASRGRESVQEWFEPRNTCNLLLILAFRDTCSLQVWHEPTTGSMAIVVTSDEAILRRARFFPGSDELTLISSAVQANVVRTCSSLYGKFLSIFLSCVKNNVIVHSDAKQEDAVTPTNKAKFIDTSDPRSPCLECHACVTGKRKRAKEICTRVAINEHLFAIKRRRHLNRIVL
jgi:hypothetical protein